MGERVVHFAAKRLTLCGLVLEGVDSPGPWYVRNFRSVTCPACLRSPGLPGRNIRWSRRLSVPADGRHRGG
jgi:hypothetical protein